MPFDARLSVARDIAAYQKHRVKHLRRHPAQPKIPARDGATLSSEIGRDGLATLTIARWAPRFCTAGR
jgi:hypothetical protein